MSDKKTIIEQLKKQRKDAFSLLFDMDQNFRALSDDDFKEFSRRDVVQFSYLMHAFLAFCQFPKWEKVWDLETRLVGIAQFTDSFKGDVK